jgi:hypothetical protein
MKYLNILYKSNPRIMTIAGDDSLYEIYDQLIGLVNRYKQYEMDVMRGMKLTLDDVPTSLFTIDSSNGTSNSVTIVIADVCHFSFDNNPLTD